MALPYNSFTAFSMTILSTHRNHSYKYRPQKGPQQKHTSFSSMKHVSKIEDRLKKKCDESKTISYDLHVYGSLYTVLLPANVDLYTGLKNYFPQLLHDIVFGTEQPPVVEEDYIEISDSEDILNRMDYLEWLCD